ncbi:MAG: NAD(P)H-hydrate dehydratase [Phycisphaeraceae bacterium]|nr:NAD(P)H-hydrate dehydratase [Phycisphaeraceae bacterium]
MSQADANCPSPPNELPRLPRRAPDSHKGTAGTVAIVGGSCAGGTRMIGAPALSALGALRAGAGLAKLVMPAPILNEGLVLCPGATGIEIPCGEGGLFAPHVAAEVVDRALANCTCIAVGPGLGVSDGACAAVLRAVQNEERPLVLDADGINALARIPEFLRDFRAAAVLTPHPGEFRTLVGAMGMKGDLGLSQSRELACEQLAQRLGRVVVLKGRGTVVSDGLRTWTCTAGHPCLATAGTGDVLTGVIAAVIAHFVPPMDQLLLRAKFAQMPADAAQPLDLFDAARLAVWAHARAGETWAANTGAEAGLLATELAGLIPAALEELRAV